MGQKSTGVAFNTQREDTIIRNLEKNTSQGFQVHSSLKDMDQYFRTPPEERFDASIEPPLYKRRKPNQLDMKRSEGLR